MSLNSVIDDDAQFLTKDDADREIHCFIDDLEESDTTWPDDNCCRFYEHAYRKGKYIDFCNNAGGFRSMYDMKDYFGTKTWKNQVSSIRCGANSRAYARDGEGSMAAGEKMALAVGPNAKNDRVKWDNVIDRINITLADGMFGGRRLQTKSTFYDEEDCKGISRPDSRGESETNNHCDAQSTVMFKRLPNFSIEARDS